MPDQTPQSELERPKSRLLVWACLTVAIVAVVVLLYVFIPRHVPLPTALAQLQGRWVVVRHHGSPSTFHVVHPDPFEGYIDIVGSQAIPMLAQKGIGWYIAIDAINTPDESPWIDWTEYDLAYRHKMGSRRGVYSFDGDTLILCMARPGEDRPQEVDENPNLGHMVVVLKRAK
jgi:uncharacterized protein (TIGR03067 family)